MKYMDENEIVYDADSTIQIQLHTSQKVAFQSSRNPALVYQFHFPVTRPTARLMGRWIIEIREHTVYMRENESSQRDDRIMLSFEEQAVEVDITYKYAQRNCSKEWESVRRIDVYPREVSRMKVTSDTASHLQQLPDTRTEDLIQTAHEHGQHLDSLVQQKINELEQMQEQQARKEKELEAVRNKLETVRNDLQAVREKLDADGKELERRQEELDKRRIEKEQLKKQLEQISVQKEFLELDCSESDRQLAEMRIRVSLDKDVLTLLDDGRALKHGTVSKTIEEIGKEIEKVEERIAGILKYRMKFNEAVDEAIFNGDGTIHSRDETGGISNGDRGAASQTHT